MRHEDEFEGSTGEPYFFPDEWRIEWLTHDPEMWDFVTSHYEEPQRHYHTMTHIKAMMKTAAALDYHKPMTKLSMWPTLSAAIAFHDIVYDPKASGGKNEDDSAVIAKLRLTDYPGMDVDLVCRLIRATASHQVPADAQGWEISLFEDFLDLDMGILATDGRTYHQYARNVRKEYIHAPLDAYVEGRLNFLGSQLDRDQIYFYESRNDGHTMRMARYFSTDAAHNNIAMEMGYLTHQPRRYLGE